ncbi:MAG: MBL fold metallo-hydrolase [Puniceicoccaceae bacterium]|nr:MAG: MBL fold metallo-hydrolase [Puniceicoccaceae bacterium]
MFRSSRERLIGSSTTKNTFCPVWVISATACSIPEMAKLRIEDDFEDVLAKAMAGQGWTAAALADKSGIERSQLESLLAGQLDAEALRAVAPVLQLSAERVLSMAEQAWYPAASLPDGVRLFNTPFPVPGYQAMTVNSYLFWSGDQAMAVDTGASAEALLAEVKQRGLTLSGLLITHSHRDHIAALDAVRAAHPQMPIYCPAGEALPGTVLLSEGAQLHCGAWQIEARETSGHSPGALSYVVSGGGGALAFVGDAIFCLSIGKAPSAYVQALEHNRKKLLSLPAETLLCPGHGPVTTVGDELQRNPFFAD